MSTSTAAATTFAALDACFTADLTAIIGSDLPQHDLAPTRFIYLVEEARDVLGASSHQPWQEAGKDLAIAAIHLTGALTAPADVQSGVLARARTHLRDATSAVH
ncbi:MULTISPECIES: hypothetical protein [unclassified Streptomyces]|uniref:hypothetical protein n=1 Tax=unclassified Streptomyces TaxID=2593676 RepID=UPI0004BDB9BF|nr:MULTISPECIES: hypothetical protein [unclassified Streptomyces]